MRGVAAKSKATEAFTKDEEEQSWSSGVLSTDNPKRLLRFSEWEELLLPWWRRALQSKAEPVQA
jgi:hypothetical protein